MQIHVYALELELKVPFFSTNLNLLHKCQCINEHLNKQQHLVSLMLYHIAFLYIHVFSTSFEHGKVCYIDHRKSWVAHEKQ